MENTPRHLLAGLAWLVVVPVVVIPLVVNGLVPSTRFHTALASAVWGLGLVAIFASWALRDAPAHGRSRGVAWVFVAAWFIAFAFVVIPYLFFTRGVRAGLLASVKFTCLCLAVIIAWFALPRLFGGLF